MHLLQAVAQAHPEILPAYYVQDYEPWFVREGTHTHATALATYTVVPGMVLFAKTGWLCRLVQERHGVPVHKVAPGLIPMFISPPTAPAPTSLPCRSPP
jgi:hypothetical protein